MTRAKLRAEDILGAYFARKPPAFALKYQRRTGRKAEGLRFEKKAQEMLCGLSDLYLPSPWIVYLTEGGRPNWCQPDGLDLNYRTGLITIVEIKYSHTRDSHAQLRGVYEPVVRRLFPRPAWGVRVVELVKWFDPDVKYPEPIEMIPNPLQHTSQKVGVHIWRP